MCTPTGYKLLPCILFLLALGEAAVLVLRLARLNGASSLIILSNNRTNVSSLNLSTQSAVAFVFDGIASIIPALICVYIFCLIFVGAVCWCLGVVKVARGLRRLDGVTSCIWGFNAATIRIITFTCNCPCYKARPRLRFQVRLGLMGSFILLHFIAMILYASDSTLGDLRSVMTLLSAISILFILLTIAIDYYQYRMWWYYRPDGAYERCRCLFCRQTFHQKHERFIPYPLLGRNRNPNEIGNQPCEYSRTGNCPRLKLEHIVIFHAYDDMPLRRFDPGTHQKYFGFHRTSPEAAVSIARTNFLRSVNPPQMLGFGIYFARSFKGAERKARHEGALICAEVNMGRVLPVTESELPNVSNSNDWHQDFDTVYYYHQDESRDEFCVKDPEQISRWIIIMNDDRLRRYGLDRAFENTWCGCI